MLNRVHSRASRPDGCPANGMKIVTPYDRCGCFNECSWIVSVMGLLYSQQDVGVFLDLGFPRLDPDLFDYLRNLLGKFPLPSKCKGVDVASIGDATSFGVDTHDVIASFHFQFLPRTIAIGVLFKEFESGFTFREVFSQSLVRLLECVGLTGSDIPNHQLSYFFVVEPSLLSFGTNIALVCEPIEVVGGISAQDSRKDVAVERPWHCCQQARRPFCLVGNPLEKPIYGVRRDIW